MMDDYTSIEGSHTSLQPNNHHDQEWFERIELNQIPRNTCTRSIEIRSTKGCYIGDNGKLPLEQTISRWLLKTDQYPNNPMMCPMNMMVLHSDVGHMMIPSSPRLYRIESIGWTNFTPDRSIPFILMMCEHGWRDYSENQQIFEDHPNQIRLTFHYSPPNRLERTPGGRWFRRHEPHKEIKQHILLIMIATYDITSNQDSFQCHTISL